MSEMKSAWEKAMEKAEKLGKPSTEELKRLEHIPTGNMLAAQYLQNDNYDLNAELTKYKGSGARNYVIEGIQEILLRNITLPHDEHAQKVISRAMEGIKMIKENTKQLDVIYERINNLLDYYNQARQQSFTQFKQNFESKLQELSQSLQQRAAAGHSIEAELQQQFQEEWRKVSNELDTQYNKTLEEHKQQILSVS
ncbi:hypothetical protein ACFLYM_01825 [Chloroflexota bacterium]